MSNVNNTCSWIHCTCHCVLVVAYYHKSVALSTQLTKNPTQLTANVFLRDTPGHEREEYLDAYFKDLHACLREWHLFLVCFCWTFWGCFVICSFCSGSCSCSSISDFVCQQTSNALYMYTSLCKIEVVVDARTLGNCCMQEHRRLDQSE